MRNRALRPTPVLVTVLLAALAAACHSKSSGSEGSGDPAASKGKHHGSGSGQNGSGDPAAPASGAPSGTAAADAGAIAAPPKFAINKPTPEPMAPPALRKPPVTPQLPNLPSPSKYPPVPAIPKAKDFGECGSVWSGDDYVPVQCVDPGVHAKNGKAAKVVIPYEKMKPAPGSLPQIVDHRADGTEGPVRSQGNVPACTAFSFTAALDHAYARWTGTPGAFSVLQVWARYHTTSEKNLADNNVGDLLANEADWPYDQVLGNSWRPCEKVKNGGPCGKTPDADKLKSLDKVAVAELTQVEVVPPSNMEVVREKIAGGQDVVMALALPTFKTVGDPGAKYILGVPKGQTDAPKKGGHVVPLVGYAMTPNGNYYLIHNSWGEKWGDKGYAWLHEDFIKAYWNDKIMLIPDVEPIQVAQARQKAHGKFATCKGGEVPDSISGLCAVKCKDGSPRHNNVCADPDKKECPAGTINLTGECVMQAPKGSGNEGGVAWDCGPGGCTYRVPSGQLGCKEGECEVSCPAPDFRLATIGQGLACVE